MHKDTLLLESSLSDSCSGGTAIPNGQCHHRGTREEGKRAFNGATGKERLQMRESSPSRASPLPSSAALSPNSQPLQHGSHQLCSTDACDALPIGGDRFSDEGGESNQLENDFKEGSSTESVCHDDDDKGSHLRAEDTLTGSRATRPPPGFEPPTVATLDERVSDRDVEQLTSPPDRRGTKRQSAADITLAQVIDHHMTRRRLNGEASGCGRVGVNRNLSCARASSGETLTSADNARGKNHENRKWPSAGAGHRAPNTQRSYSDRSSVVVAAWTNGCVLPLTQVVAPHMRLVAPILAPEPEGRRVVFHTAAAVAAQAVMLALPSHRFEVMGTCRDGLMLELHPKEEGLRCSDALDQQGEPAFLSAGVERLRAAFNGLVKLDLEFDMVQLPYREAMDIVDTRSSSAELMQWLNEGTTTLVRLSAPSAPQPRRALSVDQAPRGDGLIELRKALAHPGGTPFLGVDCNLWPLLPSTGLLESFGVDFRPVVLPLPEPISGGRGAHRSVIHLAVTLSDSGTSPGSKSDPLGGVQGGRHQPIRSTPGSESTESSVISTAAAVDLPQPDSSPLKCTPPTCTAGGLTWRHVTGLRCVAAVNKMALGSRKELEGKLQLAEGLHTAEVRCFFRRR